MGASTEHLTWDAVHFLFHTINATSCNLNHMWIIINMMTQTLSFIKAEIEKREVHRLDNNFFQKHYVLLNIIYYTVHITELRCSNKGSVLKILFSIFCLRQCSEKLKRVTKIVKFTIQCVSQVIMRMLVGRSSNWIECRYSQCLGPVSWSSPSVMRQNEMGNV